jgi:uncharacterized membrane protein HdeD (DUF308 family)
MKGLLNKIKLNARTTKIMAGSAIAASAGAMVGASATTASGLVNNLLGYVFGIFKYIGLLLLAWGVGQLVLAFKNEDADSKSRAMMLVVVAIILTVLSTVFNGVTGQSASTKDF